MDIVGPSRDNSKGNTVYTYIGLHLIFYLLTYVISYVTYDIIYMLNIQYDMLSNGTYRLSVSCDLFFILFSIVWSFRALYNLLGVCLVRFTWGFVECVGFS